MTEEKTTNEEEEKEPITSYKGHHTYRGTCPNCDTVFSHREFYVELKDLSFHGYFCTALCIIGFISKGHLPEPTKCVNCHREFDDDDVPLTREEMEDALVENIEIVNEIKKECPECGGGNIVKFEGPASMGSHQCRNCDFHFTPGKDRYD